MQPRIRELNPNSSQVQKSRDRTLASRDFLLTNTLLRTCAIAGARAIDAIVTLCIGEQFGALSRLTHPYMSDYADRHGLQFIVLDERVRSDLPPHFTKFEIGRLLEQFERVVYVDTDVLVHPHAPNVISQVPGGYLGAYLANRHSNVHDDAIAAIQNELGSIGWTKEYFNSGVFVVAREHADIFDSRLGLVESFWEQTQLNYNVQRMGIPIFDLTYLFNHVQAAGDSSHRRDSHCVHYAGPGHYYAGPTSRYPPREIQVAMDVLKFALADKAWQLTAPVFQAVEAILDRSAEFERRDLVSLEAILTEFQARQSIR